MTGFGKTIILASIAGFRFFLLFNKREPHFMWVLDEEKGIPATLEPLSNDIVHDKLSGFAFYVRKKDNRKVLIGVSAQNVRRNNYWDGPFDQLADNCVNPKLAELIQLAYPYTRGRIDKYGKFTDEKGLRIAITPYREYGTLEDLIKLVKDCKKTVIG